MSINVPQVIEGKTIPTADRFIELLNVDNNTNYATVQIIATNKGTNTSTFQIAITEASVPENVEDVDLIESGDELKPRGRYSSIGLLVPGNRRIFVKANTSDVVFRATALCQVS